MNQNHAKEIDDDEAQYPLYLHAKPTPARVLAESGVSTADPRPV